MRIESLDIILGVGLGLLAIYITHDFLWVDRCLDMGGAIERETGVCIDINGHVQPVLTFSSLAVCFFLGLLVSLIAMLTVKKLRSLSKS